MFLVRNKSIPVRSLRLLLHSNPGLLSPSNLGTQTIRHNNFTNIPSKRFQHTTTPTVTPSGGLSRRPLIKSEQLSINSSSDTIENDQANRLQQQPRLENVKPLEEESITGPATKRKKAFPANKWRKMYGERASARKDYRSLHNDYLKDRGRFSYDWYIILRLLERQFPKQNDRPEKPPDKEPVGLVRRPIWHPKRRKLCQLHVDQIKQPSAWSITAFCDYIQDLTTSRVDILMHRRLYANGDSHIAAVERRLGDLFFDPSMGRFLRPAAFNLAFEFFCRSNTLPPALALFKHMDNLQMEILSDTSDIMLRCAASCNDLFNFTRLLRFFIKREVPLTAKAWTSLAMAVRSRNARAVIITSMRERGVLENFSAMRDIAKIVAGDEMIKHLESNLDVASFLPYMDSQFGTEWLTTSAGNVMLYEMGQRKSIPDVISMFDTLRERGMVADSFTLNTLLTICTWDRNHLLAIEVLRKLQVEHRVRLDSLSYQLLFQQAWRSRMYNFATVVWRSACIKGLATFEIRDFVQKNLQRRSECLSTHGPESRAYIWAVSAGEVMVGVDQSASVDDILFPSSGDTVEPLVWTQELRRARNWLIIKDITAVGRYRLVEDLAALLLKALHLDKSWMESGAWKTQSARWKRENALPVLVERVE